MGGAGRSAAILAWICTLLYVTGLPKGATGDVATPSPSTFVHNPQCGPAGASASCPSGLCCSSAGYCGSTDPYCNPGNCQSGFGSCWNSASASTTMSASLSAAASSTASESPVSLTPTPSDPHTVSSSATQTASWSPSPSHLLPQCGPLAGGAVCNEGLCCSPLGWCGITAPYCNATACLTDYGYCWVTVTPSATGNFSTSPTASPTITPSPGSPSPSPVYSGTVPTQCGNGVCEAAWLPTGENCGNCPLDCSGCQVYKDAYGCATPGEYALTFDDGPMPGPTNQVLSVLAAQGLTAAFFLIGANIDKPGGASLLQAEEAAGHTTLSHTYTHPYLTSLSPQGVYTQMALTQQAFAGRTCRRPTLMRPPYGDIDDSVRRVLHAMGFQAIIWAIDTKDWDLAQAQPAWVLGNFTNKLAAAFPGGVFSLEHDIFQYTVDLVPDIISIIRNQQYKFVSLHECLYGPSYTAHPSWVWEHQLCNQTVAKWPAPTVAEPCPVSDWSQWSFCDAGSCGTGTQTRIRLTRPPSLINSVYACAALPLIEQRGCDTGILCSPNCVYSAWTFWSPCSQPCGGGTQLSIRALISTNASDVCGAVSQTALCNTQACMSPSPTASVTSSRTPSVTPSRSGPAIASARLRTIAMYAGIGMSGGLLLCLVMLLVVRRARRGPEHELDTSKIRLRHVLRRADKSVVDTQVDEEMGLPADANPSSRREQDVLLGLEGAAGSVVANSPSSPKQLILSRAPAAPPRSASAKGQSGGQGSSSPVRRHTHIAHHTASMEGSNRREPVSIVPQLPQDKLRRQESVVRPSVSLSTRGGASSGSPRSRGRLTHSHTARHPTASASSQPSSPRRRQPPDPTVFL